MAGKTELNSIYNIANWVTHGWYSGAEAGWMLLLTNVFVSGKIVTLLHSENRAALRDISYDLEHITFNINTESRLDDFRSVRITDDYRFMRLRTNSELAFLSTHFDNMFFISKYTQCGLHVEAVHILCLEQEQQSAYNKLSTDVLLEATKHYTINFN
jgi:hypothetical protein